MDISHAKIGKARLKKNGIKDKNKVEKNTASLKSRDCDHKQKSKIMAPLRLPRSRLEQISMTISSIYASVQDEKAFEKGMVSDFAQPVTVTTVTTVTDFGMNRHTTPWVTDIQNLVPLRQN